MLALIQSPNKKRRTVVGRRILSNGMVISSAIKRKAGMTMC
jgi:hypothetical protein